MKLSVKKILSATLASVTLLLSGQALAADVEVNRVESSAEDWENDAGEVVVKGSGGETSTYNATTVDVAINSGSYTGIFGGMTSTGYAANNIIDFKGGNVTGGIVGGFTFYNENLAAGNVFGNIVNFSNGTTNWISGGEVGYVGSSLDFTQLKGGNVYNNTVNISGGTVNGGVIGGSALTGSATDNKINISGGTVSGVVIAGEVQQPQSSSEVKNNTITITGSPDLSGATFYGGLYGSSGYESTGNILQINTSDIEIGSINADSFSKVEFGIPQAFTAGGTVVTLNDSSSLSSNMNKIGITLHGDSPLQTGDTFNLVVNGLSVSSDLVSSADSTSVPVTVAKGALLTGTVDLLSTDDGITATVGEFDYNQPAYEEVAKTSEGEFAQVIIPELDPFTQSMTDSMLEDEDSSTEAEFSTFDIGAINGYSIFLNSGGGRIKTKTGGGTYIRTSRGNYDLGFSRTFEGVAAGRLYIAPVFERAQGHYTAQLPKNSLGQWMKGHGSTKYTAGGLIARLLNKSGFYYEGSIRGGKAENSFGSSDFIIDDIKTHVTYDMSAPVWTGHLRFGKALKLNPKTLLDSYLTYSYTHQRGMSTTMSEGTHVNFDSVSGHSLRLGYRMTTRSSKISKVYGGLAWQYDKNSDSSVTAFNQSKKSDGSKGHSGMIELGWQIKPNRNTPWIVDINATGWMGRMQGFNVMAKIQKEF